MIKHMFRMICVISLGALVVASGCAAKGNAPVGQLENTEKMINDAKNENATVHAPLELKMADEKLKAAKAAIKAENYDQARRLLDEAKADADLAVAKSASAKTRLIAKEMNDSIETLRKEVERPR
jgi:hypothetical protein